MADQDFDTAADDVPKPNGAIRMSLPAVLCTPDPMDSPDNSKMTVKSLMSSESKLSLPSNLGTPTSPLRVSSPISLPTSPTPFQKISMTGLKPISPKSTQLLAPTTDNVAPTGNTASATGK